MDEEGIGLVLAKATELRLKIGNCIHKATSTSPSPSAVKNDREMAEAEDDEQENGAERLLNICDALEGLETQLSSLQALLQHHQFEREAALAEIDRGRDMLVDKLKKYKGENLEVINEASAFAGETVQHDSNLLLPPYPSHPPRMLHLDNSYLPQVPSTLKSVRNGVITGDRTNKTKKNVDDSGKSQPKKGMGRFINVAAKTTLTIVGVISVMTLAGVGPKFAKRDTPFKISSLFQQPSTEEKRSTVRCPPGKVLVVEDGKTRCLAKERVEVPFESVVATPDDCSESRAPQQYFPEVIRHGEDYRRARTSGGEILEFNEEECWRIGIFEIASSAKKLILILRDSNIY